jgi:hypothetical protein
MDENIRLSKNIQFNIRDEFYGIYKGKGRYVKVYDTNRKRSLKCI